VEGRWVDVEGGRLRLDCAGEGPPLVLLHAGVADRRMWQPQLEALADRYRLIAYDRRGFGESHSDDVPFSAVDDLIAVLDAQKLDTVALVGCSQGGRIAIDAALARPERVSALALVAPALSGFDDDDFDYPPAVIELDEALTAAEEAGDLATVNSLEARAWLVGMDGDPDRLPPELHALFEDMNAIALRAGPLTREQEPPSAIARLAELTQPVLLAWGDLDLPVQDAICELLASRLPDVRTLPMPGTAHLGSLEQPERFNAALVAFLGA